MNQNQSLHDYENQFVNMESCLDRTSQAVLFHRKEYPLEYIARTYFPADTSEDQIKSALQCDNRFVLSQSEEGVMVDRASYSITASERRVLGAVEQWKDNMAHYFKSYQGDVKLCVLSQIVKRPEGVPRGVKLIDILNTDSQRRFLLISHPSTAGHPGRNADDVMVKYKCTPFEVETFHEEWRENLAGYLIQQDEPVALVTIGTHVAKPKNLGKNQKLIDIVKMDKLNRFRSIADPSHNSLTRLTVTDDYCCQKWREKIYQLWKSSSFKHLNNLDYSRTPRPRALKVNYSVLDMIVEDPLKRFQDTVDFDHLKHVYMKRQAASNASYHRPPRPPPTLLLPAALMPTNPSPRPGNVHSTPLGSWSRGQSSGVDARNYRQPTMPSNHQMHRSSASCLPPCNTRQQLQQQQHQYTRHNVIHQQQRCESLDGPSSSSISSPQRGSQNMSAAAPPPGFGKQWIHLSPLSTTHPHSPPAPPGFPQGDNKDTFVLPAASSVADVDILPPQFHHNDFVSDENMPPYYANQQTGFSCYDDSSPPMPDILKNVARGRPGCMGDWSNNDGAGDFTKFMSSSVQQPTSSSLDDDVAAEYKEMDTVPGFFRFVSN